MALFSEFFSWHLVSGWLLGCPAREPSNLSASNEVVFHVARSSKRGRKSLAPFSTFTQEKGSSGQTNLLLVAASANFVLAARRLCSTSVPTSRNAAVLPQVPLISTRWRFLEASDDTGHDRRKRRFHPFAKVERWRFKVGRIFPRIKPTGMEGQTGDQPLEFGVTRASLGPAQRFLSL
jgi:hypothetical protein